MLYSIRRRSDERQFLQYPRLFGDLDGDGLSEFGFGDLSEDGSAPFGGRITFFKGAPGYAEQICVGLPNSTGQAARLRSASLPWLYRCGGQCYAASVRWSAVLGYGADF